MFLQLIQLTITAVLSVEIFSQVTKSMENGVHVEKGQ